MSVQTMTEEQAIAMMVIIFACGVCVPLACFVIWAVVKREK
jgi:hypothetical protein